MNYFSISAFASQIKSFMLRLGFDKLPPMAPLTDEDVEVDSEDEDEEEGEGSASEKDTKPVAKEPTVKAASLVTTSKPIKTEGSVSLRLFRPCHSHCIIR